MLDVHRPPFAMPPFTPMSPPLALNQVRSGVRSGEEELEKAKTWRAVDSRCLIPQTFAVPPDDE